MNKDEIREKMRKRRREMTAAEVAEKSEKIKDRLLPLDCYNAAKTVMLYISAYKEPATDGIIRSALNEGKNVIVPVSDTAAETIIPSRLKSADDLQKGAYGIFEPKTIIPADMSEVDFVLVPGLAFDKSGNRVGFGKGYYDKLLCNSRAVRCALCYEFQLFDAVPSSKHDAAMNIIITEENTYVI